MPPAVAEAMAPLGRVKTNPKSTAAPGTVESAAHTNTTPPRPNTTHRTHPAASTTDRTRRDLGAWDEFCLGGTSTAVLVHCAGNPDANSFWYDAPSAPIDAKAKVYEDNHITLDTFTGPTETDTWKRGYINPVCIYQGGICETFSTPNSEIKPKERIEATGPVMYMRKVLGLPSATRYWETNSPQLKLDEWSSGHWNALGYSGVEWETRLVAPSAFRIDVTVSNEAYNYNAPFPQIVQVQTNHLTPFHFAEAKVVKDTDNFDSVVSGSIGQLLSYLPKPILQGTKPSYAQAHDRYIPLRGTVIGGYTANRKTHASADDKRYCVWTLGPGDRDGIVLIASLAKVQAAWLPVGQEPTTQQIVAGCTA